MTATLSISKTRLAIYEQCPSRFARQYVRKDPWEFVPASLLFGRAVHAAGALYHHAVRHGLNLSTRAVVAEFDAEWESGLAGAEAPVRYPDAWPREALTDVGRALLRQFVAAARPRSIQSVEEQFELPVPGADARLRGIFDLVEADEEGSLVLVEMKTALSGLSDRQAEEALDGAVYGWALRQLGRIPAGTPVLMRYDVLIKRRRPAVRQTWHRIEPEVLERFERRLHRTLAAIARREFAPRTGWHCAHCPFRRACRGASYVTRLETRQAVRAFRQGTLPLPMEVAS